MMKLAPLRQRRFEAPCRIDIECSAARVHAHVEFGGDVEIGPGDRILVHEPPTCIPFGKRLMMTGTATVVSAGLVERLWTQFAGHFGMTELYDVSFTERRRL